MLHAQESTNHRQSPRPGGRIRTIVVSLVGAAALTAGLVLIKQQKQQVETLSLHEVPPGEAVPGTISLERLRELGY